MKKLLSGVLFPCLALCLILAGCGKSGTTPENNTGNEPGDGTTTEDIKADPSALPDKIVLAYVTSWGSKMPDVIKLTHISYAFGNIKSDFSSIHIDGESRLKTIIYQKRKNKDLKVLLCIGGWGSGKFSEMAASETFRKRFASNCMDLITNTGIDGIDIDWEYPTSSVAGISSSPDDTRNFTLMIKAIRNAIGSKHLLTVASPGSASYINWKDVIPYVDFVNVMTYDMANPPYHDSPLHRSDLTGWLADDEAVLRHTNAGIPYNRLLLGIPFYGRGTGKDGEVATTVSYSNLLSIIESGKFTERWDDVAKVPYLTNPDGKMVCSYENPRSVSEKCTFAKEKGLRGVMYWSYSLDDDSGSLRDAACEGMLGSD
ncbi:MAG: glycoside hydrolase family 18 protein [Bacteroidales bacterium]|jgi:chitinase|nr:glycoside hydrolase family 18 protein [Bacteroidales bacterium]